MMMLEFCRTLKACQCRSNDASCWDTLQLGIANIRTLPTAPTTLANFSNPSLMVYGNLDCWRAASSSDFQALPDFIHREALHVPAILDKPVTTETGVFVESPLLCAIRHNRIENVRILLSAGANPNGVSIEDMLRWAALNLGLSESEPNEGMNEDRLIVDMDQEALYSLVCEKNDRISFQELERLERIDEPVATPFWHGVGSSCAQVSACLNSFSESFQPDHGAIPLPSLLVAARYSSPEVVDQLLAYGADASFWTAKEQGTRLPADPTWSAVCPTTPLHVAIGRDGMIEHLLSCGFNPNIHSMLPLTGAANALQFSIIMSNVTGLTAFEVLLRDGRSDLSLRTPYLEVSTLHLAVATLNQPLLERLLRLRPLDASAVTRLGHTVLHVACLPGSDSDIKYYNVNSAAQESVHDLRGLPGCRGELQHGQQRDVVLYLLEHINDASAWLLQRDWFGNTPLHYLASAQEPNQALLADLWSIEGVLDAWASIKNRKGYTSSDLYRPSER